MKFRKVISITLAALMLNGCSNLSGQDVGTVAGGVTGAAVGSMFGGGTGQIVAVGAGAVIGGLAGNSLGKDYDDSHSAH